MTNACDYFIEAMQEKIGLFVLSLIGIFVVYVLLQAPWMLICLLPFWPLLL